MIIASHKWPEPLTRFWVPTVEGHLRGRPRAAVAGAHVRLALVIRAIEYAHGELEGADDNDLVAMAGDITAVDELIAGELVRQARTLAAILRAYARERKRHVRNPHESHDYPF